MTGWDFDLRAAVTAHVKEEYDRIERDLLTIPGVHEEMTHAEALALDLEVQS